MTRVRKSPTGQTLAAGFTLPAILVVSGALLILAVGILLVATIERSSTRSFVDRQRAELAARAGLEDIRSILNQETANDEFIVLQSTLAAPITTGRTAAPRLFLARGKSVGSAFTFRYVPLFSTLAQPTSTPALGLPPVESLSGTNDKQWLDFTTLPYTDKVRAAWLPVLNEKGQTVARYVYWVEDLQGKIDPKITGNLDGAEQTHRREPYPFLAPGLDDPVTGAADQSTMNQVALYAIDPTATDTNQAQLGRTLIDNRKLLVSPGSLLAAASISPPITRDATGHLIDPKARAAEESLTTGLLPYEEQPMVPFVTGIDPSIPGKLKLNLNQLIAKGGKSAVEEMADFINKAYPTFEERKGGFPDNYVKTLAANAIDYADTDDRPTLLDGEYRGIDSYPLTTEIVLMVTYKNFTVDKGRQYLNFNLRLYGELYNPTDLEISGSARLSYEVALKASALGTGTENPRFDSEELLENLTFSSNPESPERLVKIDGKYWTKAQDIVLRPNEYKSYRFADITYHIDQGTAEINEINETAPFSLEEKRGEAGCSLMWNNDIVEHQYGLVRQDGFIYGVSDKTGKQTGGYLVGKENASVPQDVLSKDHLPGLLYQVPDETTQAYGNTGDPRISHYMNRSKTSPLEENAYPSNASPNRRSVRIDTYKDDAKEKSKLYVRTLPSEWPDGGHDSLVGDWTKWGNDDVELIDPKYDFPYDTNAKFSAIQRISNRGYYLSATELGHIFDPIMYAPTYNNLVDTAIIQSASNKMPPGQVAWPDAKIGKGSPLYGGGNTLRIGRPEHSAFAISGPKENRAIGLLDLFHTGQPLSADPALREGSRVRINGQVNINTASRDALRAIAAGALVMDPSLSKKTDKVHAAAPYMAPPTVPLRLDAPQNEIMADRVADAVIAGRPYASPSRIAHVRTPDGKEVFGNRDIYPDKENVQWTDSAAEEVFGRMFQAATVRSRNFRVWIVAQSVAPATSPSTVTEVLAEVRKVYTLMADPGERTSEGVIIPRNMKTRILTIHDF